MRWAPGADCLFQPYSDDPGNSGLLLIDPKVLEATTAPRSSTAGRSALTPSATREMPWCSTPTPLRGRPFPKHATPGCGSSTPRSCARRTFRGSHELGVIASMQPSHASDDMRWADARLGPGRVDGAYAWRWFADAGVTLAHGSDFPVEIVSPFWGIYAGVTRQDRKGKPAGGWHPEQRLSLEETLTGFTAGAAFAAFAEDSVGILKPGMRADLTIVDRDLFLAKNPSCWQLGS